MYEVNSILIQNGIKYIIEEVHMKILSVLYTEYNNKIDKIIHQPSNPLKLILLTPSSLSPQNGYTPLHIAAKKNQMDIGTTLLEYGADTNAVTRQGISPIHLAAQEGSVDLVSLLLAKNANVNMCNKVESVTQHAQLQVWDYVCILYTPAETNHTLKGSPVLIHKHTLLPGRDKPSLFHS